MSWVEPFQWTSRTAVCDQLTQFLFQNPPSPSAETEHPPRSDRDRRAVVDLLFLFADESCIPTIRRILFNQSEDRWVRINALQTLSEMEMALPASEYEQLLRDRSLWEGSLDGLTGIPDFSACASVLAEIRSPEGVRIAQTFLGSWPAVDRARLLRESYCTRLGSELADLADWLYHRWLNEDRLTLEGVQGEERPLNVEVAISTHERPESRALLVEYWCGCGGEQRRELLSEYWADGEIFTEAPTAGSTAAQELAEALVLPRAILVDQMGPERLFCLIEEKIKAANHARRTYRYALPDPWRIELDRALNLLRDWPDAGVNERICSLLCCPDLDLRLRTDLLKLLWRRDPDKAASALRMAINDSTFIPLLRRFARHLALKARSTERDLLLWAVAQEVDPVIRYYALQALERLGEDSSAWRDRLEELTRDADRYLSLRATAALLRRGDSKRLAEIAAAATADHVCVRAEALRILGELEPGRHEVLFRRSLLEDHDRCGRCPEPLPACEEAAAALARLGTPEAMTDLIHGYLIVRDQELQPWIGSYLSRLLRAEERAVPLRWKPRPWGWCRLHEASPQRCSPSPDDLEDQE